MPQSSLIRYIQSILHYPHLFVYLCKIKAPTQHLYHVVNILLCLLVNVFEEFMLMLNYIPSILNCWKLYISSPNYNLTSWLNVTKIALHFYFQESTNVATRVTTAHKSNHARKNISLIATRAFDLRPLRSLLFLMAQFSAAVKVYRELVPLSIIIIVTLCYT